MVNITSAVSIIICKAPKCSWVKIHELPVPAIVLGLWGEPLYAWDHATFTIPRM